MPTNQQQRFDRALIFVDQALCQLDIRAKVPDVSTRNVDVRLRANHLGLAEHVVDKGPRRRHPLQAPEAGSRRNFLTERTAYTEPAREHQSDLGPSKAPRYCAYAINSSFRSWPIGRTRAEASVGQLVDRRCHPK